MKKIAILASGSGTNAENIVRYFEDNENLNIVCVYSNKGDAFVLERAKMLNIPTVVFDRHQFYDTDIVLQSLLAYEVDLVVLAGFLWLVPHQLIDNFSIINIHPALLPKYGGKGLYGHRVHEAVVANKEVESGITIHFVNEQYDDGQIIFQAKCEVSSLDTPDDVAAKIHELEQANFPKVIEQLLFRS
jgi:phosphoribosylglycinamide formyltransferase-1